MAIFKSNYIEGPYHLFPVEGEKDNGEEGIGRGTCNLLPAQILYERCVGTKDNPGIEIYYEPENLNPHTIDLPITEFFDLGQNKLSRPFEVPPHEKFYGWCPIVPKVGDNEFLVLENRSNVARTFLHPSGFYTEGRPLTVNFPSGDIEYNENHGNLNYSPFLSTDHSLNGGFFVMFENCATVPYVIDKSGEPIFPIQVSNGNHSNVDTEAAMEKIRLFQNEVEVTQDRRHDGDMPGYFLTLAPEISWIPKGKEGKIRYSNRKEDSERLLENGNIEDAPDDAFQGPSLTNSNEVLEANTTCYVFPTHAEYFDYRRFSVNSKFMSFENLEAVMAYRLFDMLITANSGMCHKGVKNTTVFENIPGLLLSSELKLPIMKKYMMVNGNYGLLVPLGSTEESHYEYNGGAKTQNNVCLIDPIKRG